jgi:hypothetical protein
MGQRADRALEADVTYGIWNLEAGSAIAWFDSTRDAYEAVLLIAATDPAAIDELGLVTYTDDGAPTGEAMIGQELINEAQGVLA